MYKDKESKEVNRVFRHMKHYKIIVLIVRGWTL